MLWLTTVSFLRALWSEAWHALKKASNIIFLRLPVFEERQCMMLYWIGRTPSLSNLQKMRKSMLLFPHIYKKTIIIQDCYNACNHPHPWPSNASKSSLLSTYMRCTWCMRSWLMVSSGWGGLSISFYWWLLCPLVWINDLPCRSCCCFHVNVCEVIVDYNCAGNSVGSSLHCAYRVVEKSSTLISAIRLGT